MKKIIGILLSMVFIFNFVVADEISDMDLRYYLSEENQKDLLESEKSLNEYMKQKYNTYSDNIVPFIGGGKRLNVRRYQQKEDYYCGVACTQMLLKYKGYYYDQDDLAGEDKLKTRLNGATSHQDIVNFLKTTLGRNSYLLDHVDDRKLFDGLVYSIDKNSPIICLLSGSGMKRYGFTGPGHYILGIGYRWYAQGSNGYSDIIYHDPHINGKYFGTFTEPAHEIEAAMKRNDGYFIRAK